MKLLLLLPIAAISFSCSSKQITQGTYYKNGKDYEYTLILRKDSTFELTKRYPDVNAKCKGKWTYVKNTVLLECYEENDALSQISTGYLVERKQEFFVLNSNKIRINKVILKKKHTSTLK